LDGSIRRSSRNRGTATPQRAALAALARALAGPGAVLAEPTLEPIAGIPLVDTTNQSRPASDAQAQAISDAIDLAMEHPEDLSYPWFDPATETVVLGATTPRGAQLLTGAFDTAPVRHTTRSVERSYGELTRIADEITLLGNAGVPGADRIYQTIPDHLDNRITIKVSALDDGLLQYLTKKYGNDAIAIHIDPVNDQAWLASRDVDTSPVQRWRDDQHVNPPLLDRV
jgi:hypothetical protein